MQEKSTIIKIDHTAVVSKQGKKNRKFFNEIGMVMSWSGLLPEISVNCDEPRKKRPKKPYSINYKRL